MIGRNAARGLASWFAALLCLASVAQAQATGAAPVLVELYTSQGCSSCPPADALLAELAERDDVLALALHVDYWDYLGWADAFARPEFTQRQKRYARAAGARMIYTPQMVIAGTDRVQGHKAAEIADRIAAHAASLPRVALSVTREGQGIRIQASAEPPLSVPAIVHLVRYVPEQAVSIERGENAGREVLYRNIVTEWRALAEWAGAEPVQLRVSAERGHPLAVIVQEQGPGAVLAAARID